MTNKISFRDRLSCAKTILFGNSFFFFREEKDKFSVLASHNHVDDTFNFLLNCSVQIHRLIKEFLSDSEDFPDDPTFIHLALDHADLVSSFNRIKANMSGSKEELIAKYGEEQYEIMKKQKKYMGSYLHALTERLSLLSGKKDEDQNTESKTE